MVKESAIDGIMALRPCLRAVEIIELTCKLIDIPAQMSDAQVVLSAATTSRQ